VLRILFILTLFFFYPQSSVLAQAPTAILETKTTEQPKPMPVHDEYLAYFEEVYKVMDSNYYFDIQRSDFDRFLKVFEEKIYKNLLLEGKSSDYVRWRSAAYLVDFLKQPDDIFSRFLPPKPAEKFAQEVYGEKIDLGIEGHLVEPGFQVDFVEPRDCVRMTLSCVWMNRRWSSSARPGSRNSLSRSKGSRSRSTIWML
jgi:hypothetical protein